jgi:hypothetical protein
VLDSPTAEELLMSLHHKLDTLREEPCGKLLAVRQDHTRMLEQLLKDIRILKGGARVLP